MKIYKYRDLSKINKTTFEYLYQIIFHKMIWCASPDSLNDKDEFIFKCEYNPTEFTISLLTQVHQRYGHLVVGQAQSQLMAANFMKNNWEVVTQLIFKDMVDKCRRELGLACFSSSKNNDILWERYGGCGNGLCIGIEVPDDLMNKTLFRVNYVEEKIFHIDSILESALFNDKTINAYRNILLTKTMRWKSEKEVRIVTKQQNIQMHINGSFITDIIFGKSIELEILNKIKKDIQRNSQCQSIILTELA